jgi:hypothetical protein
MMKLKKIYTAHFPKKGFTALTICPFVFVRSDEKDNFSDRIERHETTHALQQVECLWIFFLIIYCFEFLFKLPFCMFDTDRAYRSISFEQEAYAWQDDKYYNRVRPMYEWRYYIFTLTPKKK